MKYQDGHNKRSKKVRHEFPDPTPMAVPVQFKRPPTLNEQIRQMCRSEQFRQQMQQAGAETFEEADDFEIGDDYDPKSPYESNFDQESAESPARAAQSSKTFTEEKPVKKAAKKAAKTPAKKAEVSDTDEDCDDE